MCYVIHGVVLCGVLLCCLVLCASSCMIWKQCSYGCDVLWDVLWITKCSAVSGSLGGIYAVEDSCGNLWLGSVCFTVCIRAGCSHRVI